MLRRLPLLICTILLVLFVLPAQAAKQDGLSFLVSCEGFASFGGSLILDRDNTGAGREAYQIVATDGDGTVLYASPIESFLVGGVLDFPRGYRISFASTPDNNPISVSLVSLEGNGLRAQTVYQTFGRCAGLPTLAQTVPVAETSPSLPLNTVPPLSRASADQLAGEPGVIIVNTAYLNLRSGDGPQYTIVGRASGGARLIPLGRNAKSSWWYVQAGDVRGWVLGELVIIRGNLTGVPVVDPAGELAVPRFVLYRDANLLTLADATSAPVCQLAGNLEYVILGRTANSSFFYVSATCIGGGSAEGWLPAELGAVRNSGNLPIPVR